MTDFIKYESNSRAAVRPSRNNVSSPLLCQHQNDITALISNYNFQRNELIFTLKYNILKPNKHNYTIISTFLMDCYKTFLNDFD